MDGGQKVLVIDDDGLHREMLKVALAPEFQVNSACSLAEAREALRPESPDYPDLIILDVNLGGQNGLDILEIIKEPEQKNLVPVIVVSGTNREDDIWQAYNGGVVDFIQKPFLLSEIKEKAGAVLEIYT